MEWPDHIREHARYPCRLGAELHREARRHEQGGRPDLAAALRQRARQAQQANEALLDSARRGMGLVPSGQTNAQGRPLWVAAS